MKNFFLSLFLFALSAVVFAQSSARVGSEDSNNPEIDNLSGVAPDIDDLAPDYGVSGTSVTGNEIGNTDGSDEDYDVVLQDNNSGLERGDALANTMVFPNPATDNITITTEVETGVIRILNLLGQQLFSYPIESSSLTFNISELKEGIYFISVESGDQKIVKKLKVLN